MVLSDHSNTVRGIRHNVLEIVSGFHEDIAIGIALYPVWMQLYCAFPCSQKDGRKRCLCRMVRGGNNTYNNCGRFVVQGAIKRRKDDFNWTDCTRRDWFAFEQGNTVIDKEPSPTMANAKRKEYKFESKWTAETREYGKIILTSGDACPTDTINF